MESDKPKGRIRRGILRSLAMVPGAALAILPSAH